MGKFQFTTEVAEKLQVPILGLLFSACVLGGATGLRNLAIVLVVFFLVFSGSLYRTVCPSAKALASAVLLVLLTCLLPAIVKGRIPDFWHLFKDYLAILVVYAFGLYFGLSERRFGQAITLQVFALALLCVLSILIFWMPVFPISIARFAERWYPWWGIASSIAVILFPLIFLFFERDASSRQKKVLIGFGIVLSLIALTAQNRMSFVVLCLVMLTCAIRSGVFSKRQLLLGGLGLILASLAMLYVKGSERRYLQEDIGRIDSGARIEVVLNSFANDPRLVGWGFWLDKIDAMPWYGYGEAKRTMLDLVSDAERMDPRLHDAPMATHAHNMVLNFALRAGFPGLLAFSWLWWRLFRMFASTGKATPSKLLETTGFGLVMSMFLKNMTDDFFEPPLTLVFFFWVGALVSRINSRS